MDELIKLLNCLYKLNCFKMNLFVFMSWCTVCQTVTSNCDASAICGKENRDNHGFTMV